MFEAGSLRSVACSGHISCAVDVLFSVFPFWLYLFINFTQQICSYHGSVITQHRPQAQQLASYKPSDEKFSTHYLACASINS